MTGQGRGRQLSWEKWSEVFLPILRSWKKRPNPISAFSCWVFFFSACELSKCETLLASD